MPALQSRPVVPPDLQPLADAFSFLSIGRAIGFGAVGAIPLAEIIGYASIYPVGMPVGDFAELIRAIDIEYIKHVNAPPNGSSPNPRRRD